MIRGSALRPCLAIGASVVVFAVLVERAGYIPAVMAAVLLASLAGERPRLHETLLLAVGVAVVMALLFVGILGQPFTLVAGF